MGLAALLQDADCCCVAEGAAGKLCCTGSLLDLWQQGFWGMPVSLGQASHSLVEDFPHVGSTIYYLSHNVDKCC